MKSKITLYYKSLLNKEKNFILDLQDGSSSISTYLSSLQSEVIDNFQYIKQGLSISIKINKNQSNLEMIDDKDLNYVMIQNFDVVNETRVYEKSYFYFVVNKVWKAKDTIELVLSMDTLNTFVFNTDYIINPKTLTKRMHKDRFESDGFRNIVLISIGDVNSSAISGADMNYLIEDQWYDTGTDMSQDNADLFRAYGGSCKLLSIYDDTDGRFLESYEYDAERAEINIQIDGNNEVYITWNIPIRTSESHDYYFNFDVIGKTLGLVRKIDLKSEDIASPVYKTKDEILKELKGSINNSWVLYYKNEDQQDDSPIECYLTSDEEMTFLTETGSNTITTSDVSDGKIIFFSPQISGDITISVDGTNYRCYTQPNLYGNTDGYYCIVIENNNGVLTFHRYVYIKAGTYYYRESRYTIDIVNPTTIQIETSIDTLECREDDAPAETQYSISSTNPFNPEDANKTLTLAPLITRVLNPSSTIDKTLQENVKIINIPYCPSTLTKDSGKYVIEELWKYDATYKFFKLSDFSRRFVNSIVSNADSILDVFTSGTTIPNVEQTRVNIDSKLYHSDYYRPKFVYDSFSRIFPLEQIDYNESVTALQSDKFKFTFVMTRNIVSKFLFKFDFVYKHSNEDYPNIVAVARNNEEVLYNSSYLNYIRTGYNYDLKSKERQETTGAVGIGLNITGLLASIGLSFVPGMQGIGVAGAIGAGLGLVGQMVNYAKSVAQNEENIQRKLQETQRQAVSVLNADDYDLLYEYTQNKAKLCLYEVSDMMKRILDDLFYYGGYVINEQMIPETNTRYWFNFVQATLVINDSSNLNSDIEEDIKEKFEQGVTFLHYHNKYDFNQEMENWETSLLE